MEKPSSRRRDGDSGDRVNSAREDRGRMGDAHEDGRRMGSAREDRDRMGGGHEVARRMGVMREDKGRVIDALEGRMGGERQDDGPARSDRGRDRDRDSARDSRGSREAEAVRGGREAVRGDVIRCPLSEGGQRHRGELPSVGRESERGSDPRFRVAADDCARRGDGDPRDGSGSGDPRQMRSAGGRREDVRSEGDRAGLRSGPPLDRGNSARHHRDEREEHRHRGAPPAGSLGDRDALALVRRGPPPSGHGHDYRVDPAAARPGPPHQFGQHDDR